MGDSVRIFLVAAFQAAKKRLWEFRVPTHFVIGNEACDLDSAVSAVARGLLLRHALGEGSCDAVIPVLNIPREELRLKTEVVFWFADNEVDPESLVCWDDIDWRSALSQNHVDVRIVDHNFLSKRETDLGSAYFERIVEVVDHHRNETEFSSNVKTHIVRDGSCSSQVFHMCREEGFQPDGKLARLLLGPILIDTANLSEDVTWATDVDRRAVATLEDFVRRECGVYDRSETFEKLQAAKSDVSALTAEQILRKDAKVVAFDDVPAVLVASFPLSVSAFLGRSDSVPGIEAAAHRSQVETIVLIGMVVGAGGSGIERDLAVYSRNTFTREKIVESLKSFQNPSLQLEHVQELSGELVSYFRQHNPKVTRKLILPLIADLLRPA